MINSDKQEFSIFYISICHRRLRYQVFNKCLRIPDSIISRNMVDRMESVARPAYHEIGKYGEIIRN